MAWYTPLVSRSGEWLGTQCWLEHQFELRVARYIVLARILVGMESGLIHSIGQ